MRLAAAVADHVPTVEIDPARMRQVVTNLVSNAIHHTPSGGSVTVGVSATGDTLAITVDDTGEGIPPDLLPHVFERLSRGRARRGPAWAWRSPVTS